MSKLRAQCQRQNYPGSDRTLPQRYPNFLASHLLRAHKSPYGNTMKLASTKPRENGKGEEKMEFEAKRLPPMPPAPNLSKVKFGKPIELFDGKDIKGWRLTDPNAANGWSAKDNVLVNAAVQED